MIAEEGWDPLGLTRDGMRVHQNHFTDPTDGLYGDEQQQQA